MLYEDEIKSLAEKKIQQMSDQEKQDVVYFSEEEEKLLRKVKSEGIRSLTKKQQEKLASMYDKEFDKRYPGGAEMAYKEQGLFDETFTRDDLKRNNRKGIRKKLFLSFALVLLSVFGMVIAAIISEKTGRDLSVSYPVFGVLSGAFTLRFATLLIQYVKSKRLLGIYETKDFQAREVDAEVYRQLLSEEKSKGRR